MSDYDDTALTSIAIATENLFVGVLRLMIEKRLVTEDEVRRMIEDRTTKTMYNIDDAGFDPALTEPFEKEVAHWMNRVAARFDPALREPEEH